MTEPVEPVEPIEPGDFVRDTEVRAIAPGCYVASIPEAWKVIYAFGGVSMACAVRAIQREVDRPDLDLLSAHAVFCSPVPCAALDISAETLRNGRTAAQGRSLLRVAGSEEAGIAASATFGRLDASPIAYLDTEMPVGAGHPDDHDEPPARPADHPFPPIPFHDQTSWRPAIGAKWWKEDPQWEPGPAVTGAWMRLLAEPTLAEGSYDPLALCIPGDSLGAAIGQHLGPLADDGSSFFTVTLELGIDVFNRQQTPWVFGYVQAPVASDGYGWGTVELFGESGELLAIAHQRARLRMFRAGDGFFG
ncbi:MAG: thioesterase family protein [Actinobacteria bacterium]|nr:thioesterase family protein [Actinomycetota bacterium]